MSGDPFTMIPDLDTSCTGNLANFDHSYFRDHNPNLHESNQGGLENYMRFAPGDPSQVPVQQPNPFPNPHSPPLQYNLPQEGYAGQVPYPVEPLPNPIPDGTQTTVPQTQIAPTVNDDTNVQYDQDTSQLALQFGSTGQQLPIAQHLYIDPSILSLGDFADIGQALSGSVLVAGGSSNEQFGQVTYSTNTEPLYPTQLGPILPTEATPTQSTNQNETETDPAPQSATNPTTGDLATRHTRRKSLPSQTLTPLRSSSIQERRSVSVDAGFGFSGNESDGASGFWSGVEEEGDEDEFDEDGFGASEGDDERESSGQGVGSSRDGDGEDNSDETDEGEDLTVGGGALPQVPGVAGDAESAHDLRANRLDAGRRRCKTKFQKLSNFSTYPPRPESQIMLNKSVKSCLCVLSW